MSSRRLVIAIDCDDVLIPTSLATIDHYNHKYGTNLQPVDFYGPATIGTWGTNDDDVAIGRVNEYTQSAEGFIKLVPFPEAILAVKALALKHELHLVSGRSGFLESVTNKMVAEYFPNCFKSIEHTNYMSLSTSEHKRRTKGEVCLQLGADLLIDDHIAHSENVIKHGVKRAILFGDYPWNQHDVLLDGIVHCVDWDSTVMEIEKIAR
jgi:5'(3')-deoxyribonucleotidase